MYLHFPKRFALVCLCFFLVATSSCSRESLEKKRYHIGIDKNWYPLNLAGKEVNMVGFTNDLLFAIAHAQNIHIAIESSSSSTLLMDLDRKVFDAVISPLKPTPRANEAYDFSEPYYLVGPVLIVPQDSPIKSLSDIEGAVIGIMSRSSLIFAVEENPPFLLKPFDSIPSMLRALDRKQIDGALVNALVAYQYTQGLYSSQFKILTTPLTNEGLRLITLETPGGHFLVQHFAEGLKEMKENGTYKRLLEKWDLIDTAEMIQDSTDSR